MSVGDPGLAGQVGKGTSSRLTVFLNGRRKGRMGQGVTICNGIVIRTLLGPFEWLLNGLIAKFLSCWAFSYPWRLEENTNSGSTIGASFLARQCSQQRFQAMLKGWLKSWEFSFPTLTDRTSSTSTLFF